LSGRQRSLTAARGRGGGGRNSTTNRHVLRRELRQRARPLRSYLGAAVVEGRSRSGLDGTSWKGIPGPLSEVARAFNITRGARENLHRIAKWGAFQRSRAQSEA